MKCPFDNVDMAFEPFYNDAFAVTTKDGKKTTLSTCVFTCMTGDPLAEDTMETERKDIMLLCREEDWPWVKANVSRGDSLERYDGTKFKVTLVEDDFTMGKLIHAREV